MLNTLGVLLLHIVGLLQMLNAFGVLQYNFSSTPQDQYISTANFSIFNYKILIAQRLSIWRKETIRSINNPARG